MGFWHGHGILAWAWDSGMGMGFWHGHGILAWDCCWLSRLGRIVHKVVNTCTTGQDSSIGAYLSSTGARPHRQGHTRGIRLDYRPPVAFFSFSPFALFSSFPPLFPDPEYCMEFFDATPRSTSFLFPLDLGKYTFPPRGHADILNTLLP
jgi:hypothetical protein